MLQRTLRGGVGDGHSLEPGPSRARNFPRDMLQLTTTARERAVVVNSNMSRGKYLAQEGPGSRLVTGSTGSAAYTWPTLTKIKTEQEN